MVYPRLVQGQGQRASIARIGVMISPYHQSLLKGGVKGIVIVRVKPLESKGKVQSESGQVLIGAQAPLVRMEGAYLIGGGQMVLLLLVTQDYIDRST